MSGMLSRKLSKPAGLDPYSKYSMRIYIKSNHRPMFHVLLSVVTRGIKEGTEFSPDC